MPSSSHLQLVQGGASNSRPTATSGGTGFDTVRFRFRDQRERYDGLRHESGVTECARGELRRTLDGVTVGAFPNGLVYVEGRVAAIVHGPEDHRLGSLAELEAAASIARVTALGTAGLETGIGRADLASELRFGDGREGMDVLRAAASAELPWAKVGTEGGKRGRLETVYWRSVQGRSVLLRLYDKGVETGDAGPGEWLRLERQRRYRKEREPSMLDLSTSNLREAYVGRELRALVERGDELHVCDELGAIERVRELLDQGEISPRVAESLIGFLWLRGAGGLPERTVERRESTLRDLGIALDRGEVERQVVNFAEVVGRFADRWAA